MPQVSARLREVIRRTDNVKSFRWEAGELAPFKAGQFLAASIGEGKDYKRYLSISNSPTETGYLEFTKKLTGSVFSKCLDCLAPGASATIEYPFGKFTPDAAYKKIIFLIGGIGITPVRSICKYAADKNLGVDIALFYSNRTAEDIIFRKDFDLMQEQYPLLRILYLLSDCPAKAGFISGRISAQVIKENAPDYPERKFFLCGPPAMVEAMKHILDCDLCLPKEHIITESFQGYY